MLLCVKEESSSNVSLMQKEIIFGVVEIEGIEQVGSFEVRSSCADYVWRFSSSFFQRNATPRCVRRSNANWYSSFRLHR
jgi:hypothetical protein